MALSAPELIPFAHKAANVCYRCRVRKQKCDRILPRCTRCASSDRRCDYTLHRPMQQITPGPQSLVFRHKLCSQSDLTDCGTTELLQTISACTNPFAPSEPTTERLWQLIKEILGLANIDILDALKEYETGMHQWCPILDESVLLDGDSDLSKDVSSNPLLILCIWLLTKRPCRHQDTMSANEIYRTMKQIYAILQVDGEVKVGQLQVGMLIAAYEVSHGLRTQANLTVSGCAGVLKILDLNASPGQTDKLCRMLGWLRPSLLRLDRMIHLSACSPHLPLAIPPDDPISVFLTQSLGSVPAKVPLPTATSPRKVFFRTAVSLASGRVSAYINARIRGIPPDETYEKVNEVVNEVIIMLDVGLASETWLHCASFAVLVCSHIQLQQIEYRLQEAHGDARTYLLYIKAGLHASRVMAWNMLGVALQFIKEADIPNIPFAALCAVLRGAIAVLETRALDDEEVVDSDSLAGLLRLTKWFGRRWVLGEEYLKNMRDLLP